MIRTALVAACLAAAGCEWPPPTGGLGARQRYPADATIRLGTPLVQDVWDFAWAPDGRVLYAMTVSHGLWAVDLATDSGRPIDSLGCRTVAVAAGPGGTEVFYLRQLPHAEDEPVRLQLVRARADSGLPVTVLADSVAFLDRLTVSADGSYAAATDWTTTKVWNVATGSTYAVPSAIPLALGPSGLLAFKAPDTCDSLSIADASAQTVASADLPRGLCVHDVRWAGDTLEALGSLAELPLTRGDALFLARSHGAAAPVHVLRYDDGVGYFSITLSPLGTRAAIWYGMACWWPLISSCDPKAHHALYVADLVSGGSWWVAGGLGSPSKTEFSPDGRRIAYQFDQTLYVSAVP